MARTRRSSPKTQETRIEVYRHPGKQSLDCYSEVWLSLPRDTRRLAAMRARDGEIPFPPAVCKLADKWLAMAPAMTEAEDDMHDWWTAYVHSKDNVEYFLKRFGEDPTLDNHAQMETELLSLRANADHYALATQRFEGLEGIRRGLEDGIAQYGFLTSTVVLRNKEEPLILEDSE